LGPLSPVLSPQIDNLQEQIVDRDDP